MTNSLSMKKITAVAAGLAIAFSVAFVSPAKAATTEELQAQISSLLAMIAGLQAQLGGTTTTGTTGTCSTTQFTLSHKQGDQGGDVMNIQKFLNTDAATQVASVGAGSPGNETAYFGAATKAAVIKFQNKYAGEVLAPVGLSAGTGYWGASSRAKANMLVASCTTTPTTPGTTVPNGVGVTVSAAAQPGNSLAVKSAARVPFTKFTVTNTSGLVQTLNSVTVERVGLATDTSFSRVMLLDENGAILGNEQVLNSNHQANVGGSITLQPGQTRTFTVAANMAAAPNPGEVAAFSVVAINTSTTVAGSLPITGAEHTVNSSLSIGTATLERGPADPISAQSKEIGTTNYKFSSVKVTAGSAEKIRVHGIRFNQSGSASASDLLNVKVTVDGVDYAPTVSADGKYYNVNFPTGLLIDKGLSKEFTISGDIFSGSGRTVSFDLYRLTDFIVTGELYGYGITPGATSPVSSTATPAYNAADVTISAGTFNAVSKSNAVPTGNVAVQVANTSLGAFTVNLAGEQVNVQTLVVTAAIGNVGGTPVGTDIDNVTLVDQNGVVLAGPVDATGAGLTGTMTFSSVTIPAGVTTLYVKGQLSSNFTNTDTIAVATTDGGWTSVVGEQSGNSISLPSFTATGNTQTVQAATVSIVNRTTPAAQNVVKGAQDHVFAEISLDAANSGESVRVTTITVTDTPASGGSAADLDNAEIWADLDSNGTYETLVGKALQFDETAANTPDTLSFVLENAIVIDRNMSIKARIIADVDPTAVATETHTMKIAAVGDVTAVGATTGTTLAAANKSISGSGQAQTVSAGGTVTAAIDASQPNASLLLDDTVNEQVLTVIKVTETANAEDLDVDSLKITNSGTGAALVSKYVFYVGATKVGEAVGGATTAEVFFPDGTVTVPKNGEVKITVKALMNNIVAAASNGGTQIIAVASGDLDTTGLSSGTAVDTTGASSGTDSTDTVFEAFPVLTFEDVNTALSSKTAYLAAKIKISNIGDRDISFTTTDRIFITLAQSGFTASTVTGLEVRDSATGTDYAANADVDWTNGIDVFDTANPGGTLVVPANGSKTLEVLVNTAGLDGTTGGSDTVSVQLDNSGTDLTFTVNGVASGDVQSTVVVPTIYGPTHSN